MDDNIKLFKLIKNNKQKEFLDMIKSNDDIDLNIRDTTNNYLIQYAIIYNNTDIVDALLNKTCKLDIFDSDSRCILYYPIKYNYLEILDKLLNYEKNNIGLALNDLQDNEGYYPIHYCYLLKNIEAIRIFIKYNIDLNKFDKNMNSILHYAVISRNFDILVETCKVMKNFNYVNSKGENIIHLASNFGDLKFVDYLLNYDINVNTCDYENGIIPIMYPIIAHNNNIFYKLLEKSDINIQDNNGNNCLHYCMFEKNYSIINSILEKKNVNYNLTNVRGETALHIFLNNYQENTEFDLKKIITNINLNIQDFKGNSLFLLLCKNNLWFKFKDILEKKKINHLLLNFNKESSLDFINDDDKDKFFNIIVTSYLNHFRNSNKTFSNKLYQLCTKNLSYKSYINATDLDDYIKEYKDKLNVSSRDVCFDLIKTMLYDDRIYYPSNEIIFCIDDEDEFENYDIISFTGSTIDLLCGMIFLHKEKLKISSTLHINFITNQYYEKFLNTFKNIYIKKDDFFNFEIMWDGKSIFYPTTLDNCIEEFKKSKNRFFIAPIAITLERGAHSNILIYDREINEIERFEPNGALFPKKFYYFPHKLDNKLNIKFSEIFKDSKYISTTEYIPKIGFQRYEDDDYQYLRFIGDPGGFCAVWCIFYAFQRCKHPMLNRKQIIYKTVNKIRELNIPFKKVIRAYAKKIVDIRDEIFNQVNLNINKWANLKFTDQQYDLLITNIKKIISYLNKDEIEETNEIEKTEEVIEKDLTEETNETDETNDIEETSETDETNDMEETSETDETNDIEKTSETDEIEETNKTDETEETKLS